MTAPKRPHHHGNLREALILAGLEIVRRDGPEALTLRKCALRAGVSHAAPAHHFNGVLSLKTAIIARGHRMFSESMRTASENAAPTAMAQVSAICAGYIAFAQSHSALFKFMFQPKDVDFSSLDAATLAEISRDAGASYGMLREACRPLGATEAERTRAEITVWSLVHGYAMLFGDAPKDPRPPSPAGPAQIPQITDLLANLNLNFTDQAEDRPPPPEPKIRE